MMLPGLMAVGLGIRLDGGGVYPLMVCKPVGVELVVERGVVVVLVVDEDVERRDVVVAASKMVVERTGSPSWSYPMATVSPARVTVEEVAISRLELVVVDEVTRAAPIGSPSSSSAAVYVAPALVKVVCP